MWQWLVQLIGKVKWTSKKELTAVQKREIAKVLSEGNFIILTRRSNHLSTYFIGLAHFFLTGRWGYWSHVCMNIETTQFEVQGSIDIIEAIGVGVKKSTFEEVFNCTSALILAPRMSDGMDWDDEIQAALNCIGTRYDDYFNLNDNSTMSCVELILFALKKDPQYRIRFHGLDAMINNEGNLTPTMYAECGSFDKVLEVRNG